MSGIEIGRVICARADRAGGQAATTSNPLSPRRRLTYGAIAGTAGAIAMTPVMVAVRRLTGDYSKVAPQVITASVIGRAGFPKAVEPVATAVAHLSFGAANGALFGLLAAPRLPGRPSTRGLVFAAAVMALSYEGWVPLAGILPPQHRQRRARALSILGSHVLYGVVLGRTVARFTGSTGSSPAG